jgi:putative sterol carrier protein
MALEEGHPISSKVKMNIPATDFLAMLDGTLSTTDAFTSWKLKVGGNLIYAMKLATVFKFGSA